MIDIVRIDRDRGRNGQARGRTLLDPAQRDARGPRRERMAGRLQIGDHCAQRVDVGDTRRFDLLVGLRGDRDGRVLNALRDIAGVTTISVSRSALFRSAPSSCSACCASAGQAVSAMDARQLPAIRSNAKAWRRRDFAACSSTPLPMCALFTSLPEASRTSFSSRKPADLGNMISILRDDRRSNIVRAYRPIGCALGVIGPCGSRRMRMHRQPGWKISHSPKCVRSHA